MNSERGTRNSAELLRAIFDAGVQAVQPSTLFERTSVSMELRRASQRKEHVAVIGAGKAGIPMALSVEKILGDDIDFGLVVVPRGYVDSLPSHRQLPSYVEIVESGHPIPGQVGADAGAKMLDIVRQYGSDCLVVVLISGGASALLPTPLTGITTDDMSQATSALLESGATIHEINTLRKHLTAIGGGRLAQAAYPARVMNYIISDVIGDDPSFIGSGPCAPDPTTIHDAREVVNAYDLWDRLPGSVSQLLRSRAASGSADTPDEDDEIFESVTRQVIGTNAAALEQARKAAVDSGLSASIVQSDLNGEAREVGVQVARAISDAADGTCLLWGGETTVTVRGSGEGGRNQELVLAAALELDRLGSQATILSAGTDGIDGMTTAAGGWARGDTIRIARSAGLDAESALENNDSGPFFEALGQQVMTGPTHTNVMDLVIAMS